MFSYEKSWKMEEPEKVLSLIKEVECWRLGNWDGCVCSRFSIRNVDVRIDCGKGGPQGVWVSSKSIDYTDNELLRPIAEEVARQLREQSGRALPFPIYLEKSDV